MKKERVGVDEGGVKDVLCFFLDDWEQRRNKNFCVSCRQKRDRALVHVYKCVGSFAMDRMKWCYYSWVS